MTVLPWIPTSNIVGSTIPSNCRYYITMFGGGSDAQTVSCSYAALSATYGPGIPRTATGSAYADGSWWYIAGAIGAHMGRFPCGTKVLVANPTTGASCVAVVADMGPNSRIVEQRANGAVIDASPLVIQHLFGRSSYGWEDRKEVIAYAVDPSTPVGPAGAIDPATACGGGAFSLTKLLGLGLIAGGAYAVWRAYRPRR